MKEQYDLIVLGAGPGGYTAAIRSAQLGLSAALVEAREVGGTCLNRGCIPTKTLLHTAGLFREMTHCEALGIQVENPRCDLAKLYARKNEVAAKLRAGVEQLVKANKIDLFRGHGQIIAADTVLVDGETSLHGNSILIACGSEPAMPPIPGLDLPGVITSDQLLEQCDETMGRLTIIGGGVIGMEFASIFSALGCEVTVIETMERILPQMDREISQNLSMILKKRGVSIHTSSRVERVTRESGLACHFSEKGQEKTVAADRILVATGRRANTGGLFGEGFSVELERGAVKVDGRFCTSAPGVYAIGDAVHGGIQLAHAAAAQGCNAAALLAGQEPPVNLSAVPSCIYTDPEIAGVGITADDAKRSGVAVKTSKFIMSANGKSLITMQERGFVKLVFHEESRVLLGAQLMCARATDLISELTGAVANRLTAGQLAAVIRPHPTFSEGISEAVEDLWGHSIHTVPRR